MNEKYKVLHGIYKKYKCRVRARLAIVAFLAAVFFGFSVNSHANIFDDIVDAVKDLFSSVKNVVESVVEDIDDAIIANVTGRCSVVKADDGDGNVDSQQPVSGCGFDVRDLKDVFEDAGGEIADKAKDVENRLSEIPFDEWEDITKPFADASKEVILFFGDTIFDPIKNTSENLLSAMSDPKSTLDKVSFPSEGLVSGTSLDISYFFDFGSAQLEFFVRGSVASNITESSINFVGINGQLTVRLRSNTTTGYTPQAMAELIYLNPVIKIEDDRITGLLVMQPNGAIYLSATALPLQFTTDLSALMKVPGLKNISLIKKISDSISADADIGSVSFTTPLTNQDDTRFNFDLTISAGVDVVAKITGNWRVKILERVSWTKNFTLDIPPLNLPVASLPDGLIGELEEDSEPSYARQVLAYSFEDSQDSDFIADKSGYGNNGRVYGGVSFDNGTAYFDGNNGYIDLPDDMMKDMDAITVYAEVFINEEQASPYFIYGLGNTSNGLGDGYLFATGNSYRNAISTCHWICEQSVEEQGVNLPRGSWQKIAYTIKGDVATIYLNGDIVSQHTDITLKPSDVGGGRTAANYIGRSMYEGDHYLNGAVREFQIWDGALTQREIVAKFGDYNTVVVRAQGASGDETVNLEIGGVIVKTWTMAKEMKSYTALSSGSGDVRVVFTNDDSGRDVQVDYVSVNGQLRQAEDQEDNTGVWGNGECGGGSKSEWLHCNGSIGFGDVSNE